MDVTSQLRCFFAIANAVQILADSEEDYGNMECDPSILFHHVIDQVQLLGVRLCHGCVFRDSIHNSLQVTLEHGGVVMEAEIFCPSGLTNVLEIRKELVA